MKIAIITNNFGKTYDGIGAYASIEARYLKRRTSVVVYTANCNEADSKLSRILNWGMTNQINKCKAEIKQEKFDAVILEYPFVEWNPSIIRAVKRLKTELKKDGGIFVLSLHEYLRVNKLRQLVIKQLCSIADLVMVSNKENKEAISAYASHIVIRDIPSNIFDREVFSENIKAEQNRYAFFGLVNSAKAFAEMLEAWDKFNCDGKKQLYILTSTELEKNFEQKHTGVIYIRNANDEQIIRILRSSQFAIIPVRPEVGRNNATFKTCSMCGCISIGKFCYEFSQLPFVVNIKSYTTIDILDGLNQTRKLSETDNMSSEATTFGMKYSPEHIANGVLEEITNYKASKEI